jgi:DNA-binding NarL/FixJ family response regulator
MSFARALVVDDLAASRQWLARALGLAFPGIGIAEAASLAEATACLAQSMPEIALIDLGLPDGSGVQLIERLQSPGAGTLCIVATVFDDDAHLFPALRAGAQGYVLKDQPPEALAEMLRGIADGQPPLSPSIARRLLRHFQPLPSAAPPAELTARETEVLRLVAKGYSAQQVADAFGLSRHTVTGYLKDIYRKLAVTTRAEATLEAARRGLIKP